MHQCAAILFFIFFYGEDIRSNSVLYFETQKLFGRTPSPFSEFVALQIIIDLAPNP
jgi:hypothetical protein